MPFTKGADGTDIFFIDTATGPSDKAAIMFTHGIAASSSMWLYQQQWLPESSGVRVITWDMRGHQHSGAPPAESSYGRPQSVEDMVAVLDACKVDKAVLVGHSLGGVMNLEFYKKHPERVRGLVLFGTGPGFKREAAMKDWMNYCELRAAACEKHGPTPEGLVNEGADVTTARHSTAHGIAHTARKVMAFKDASVIESLPNIAVPTLILCGVEDVKSPGAEEGQGGGDFVIATKYMQSKIKGSDAVFLRGGHDSNVTHPAPWNDALEAWLAKSNLLGGSAKL